MGGPVFVQTPRLALRLVQESDAPALREIWLDFAQSPFAVYDGPHPTSPRAVAVSIARWAQANRQPQPAHRFWAVCLQGRLIGYFSCHLRETAAPSSAEFVFTPESASSRASFSFMYLL